MQTFESKKQAKNGMLQTKVKILRRILLIEPEKR
jgi:hypothetical protein